LGVPLDGFVREATIAPTCFPNLVLISAMLTFVSYITSCKTAAIMVSVRSPSARA
jgi:hypothetical protein